MARKHTQAEVIEALEKTGGIVTEAAGLLGLTAIDALRLRIKNTPALQDACGEIRERTKDLAEGNIITALKAGDKDVSKWYLSALGRDRGFGNKLEVDGRVAVQPAPDLSNLSMEDLKAIEAITKKASGNSPTD
jgi:hypothetical protein